MIIKKKHNFLLTVAVLVTTLLGTAMPAAALPVETYAASSVLASGRWVKVSVPQTGLYAIPASTLSSWGFRDLSRVRVYGYGAFRTDDALTAPNFLDDLQPVTSVVEGNRVVFYGIGPDEWSPVTNTVSVATPNLFTNAGYYFVTESDSVSVPEPEMTGTAGATDPVTQFKERLQHETDEVSPGESGGFLVGEDFRYTPKRSFAFDIPGMVAGTDINMECSFVTRTLAQPSQLLFSANGTPLEGNGTDIIGATSSDSHYHGTEGVAQHVISGISGNRLTIDIEHSSSTSVYGAWLNYLAINYMRQLSLDTSVSDGHLCFSVTSSAVSLDGAKEGLTVWDVTDPRDIKGVQTAIEGGRALWTGSYGATRRYAAWNSGVKLPAPAFVERVSNQDLHAMPCANMVILTPQAWKAAADRIADIHRAEGLKVDVVDVNKVYNEFGSGCADPLAIRRFLKMLYDRGNAEGVALRYVLLMARGTVDPRHNTSVMKDAAPTIPHWMGGTIRQSLNDNEGFTTDDFFAMLEDNQGTNKGWDELSVAVGRIPVSSLSQANAYVDKLEGYLNKSKKSPWKNQVLFLADDDDNAIHMSQSETMAEQFKEDPRQQFLHNKVYIDAYEYTGGEYPVARSEMFRHLNEGTMLWVYIGHANNHSLTADGQLTFNDLNALYLKHLPIMYAATCDFLRWDSNVTSGGELLFHERYGGVIAAISATRPVYIYDNGLFSGAVGRQLAVRENDGRYGALGDVYRRAKNDIRGMDDNGNFTTKVSNTNRLRYVLMGDPAMRMAIPDNVVRLDSIGDTPCEGYTRPNVSAHQIALFKGSVTDADGNVIPNFNGTLTATVFDAERSTTSHGNGKNGVPYTFQEMGGKLFAGSTPVRNGRFELRVALPAEISDNYRPATINMYAQPDDSCSVREAIGISHDFFISGIADVEEPDTIAPSIDDLRLNHPTFTDGGMVNASPMVMATVSDNVGINLSTSGIGHSMRLTVDGKHHYNNVSDYYTPAPDGSVSGTINYPLEDLTDGPHELTLRIWDTSDNVATRTVTFQVNSALAPKIYDVYSDANPATTQANFLLSHDRPDKMLTVTVHVYNLLGAPVWSSTVKGVSDLFTSTPVTWDLCDSSGKRVPRGIYLYKAEITEDGENYSTETHRIAVSAN